MGKKQKGRGGKTGQAAFASNEFLAPMRNFDWSRVNVMMIPDTIV